MIIEIELWSAPSCPTATVTAAGPDPLLSLEVVTTPPAPVDLEVVRFDVQGPQSILPVSPSLRNVTVVRGSREALPLHLFSDATTSVDETVADFASDIRRASPPPVLVASPPRQRSRVPPQGFSIHRSDRLAKKSRLRATKPVVQAQNVMMKKLGLTSDTCPPDATSFQQFTDTFSSTLIVSQCEALDVLLPAGMGSLANVVATPVVVS